MELSIKEKYPLWFHIRLLEWCNLKCSSCYAKNHDKSRLMDFDLFREVIKKIQQIKHDRQIRCSIYLSGGEPLLHPDFFEILDYTCNYFDTIIILTNGTLINNIIKNIMKYQKKIGIQVSLDGNQMINDQIRGNGVYGRAVEALYILKKHNLQHWISYTVSKTNKECYKDILHIASKTYSFLNNVTPYTGNPDLMLNYFEWKEFKYNYEKYAKILRLNISHGKSCCGFSYNCGANYIGLTVNPDGIIAGCARINNICGSYEKMEEYFIDHPKLINTTCMKAKWATIPNFQFLTNLE